MGHILDDAEWYIADLVEEIVVEDDQRNVVHCNLVLVRADSPEQAYERAVELGRDSETSYLNSQGKRVEVRFRGLCDLNVIHDGLEHGSELTYTRKVGMTPEQVARLVAPKERLSV